MLKFFEQFFAKFSAQISAQIPAPVIEYWNRIRFAVMTRRRLALGIGVLILGGLVGGLLVKQSGASQKASQNAENALLRPVQVQHVQLEAASAPRSFVGTLRAQFEGDYAFRIAGKIAERRVQAGDRVKAGDVLAALDPVDLHLALEQAEAEFAAAQSAQKQALQEQERIASLRSRGWSTEQAADKQKTAVDEAASRRNRAEKQVEIARNAQSYATLRAVADGVILSITAEAGQVVSAGQPIARLAQSGAREALVAVPEQALEAAKSGKASVSLWSSPERTWLATLRELSPNADPATRTFLARFSIPDLPSDAPLGASLTLTLEAQNAAPVARVPLSAILNEGGGAEVYVLDKTTETLTRRRVEIARYSGKDAFIAKGLAAGEMIVTLGVHMLQTGVKVRPITDTKSS